MIWNQQNKVRIARGNLESFLRTVKRKLGVAKSDVTVCLICDPEMARLNQNFRKKKGPTDVLSFPVSPFPLRSVPSAASALKSTRSPSRSIRRAQSAKREETYLGDIAIAPAVAQRYAKKNGRTLNNELRVLILHGMLHLLGYDHETDHGEMDRLENKMRRRFGLA
jgi:probable rRNA maturation factor